MKNNQDDKGIIKELESTAKTLLDISEKLKSFDVTKVASRRDDGRYVDPFIKVHETTPAKTIEHKNCCPFCRSRTKVRDGSGAMSEIVFTCECGTWELDWESGLYTYKRSTNEEPSAEVREIMERWEERRK